MAGLLDFVLPAIFSAGDSAKRQIKGLLGDPVGTVKQFINNKNDEAKAHLADVNLSTQGRMAGLLGEQVTPEQLAADQRVNQALANAYNPAGMIVWHGSPHNFTKFDASKIGTGEGAQAYGHGLYLAESPEVATGYANKLSQVSTDGGWTKTPRIGVYGSRRVDTSAPSNTLTPGDLAVAYATMEGGKANGLLALREMAADPYITDAAKYKKAADVLSRLDPKKLGAEYGNLYKVDLPDEHIAKMLDWDKPLSQQAPEVQRAWEKFAASNKGKQYAESLGSASNMHRNKFGRPELEGMDLWGNLRGAYESSADDAAIAADFFKRGGVPGIRYLDGGSRGAGQGTSNFVVFPGNEGLLTILERNGVPLR